MNILKNDVTLSCLRFTAALIAIPLVCGLTLFIFMKIGERLGQGPEKTLAENRYEVRYFPNRMVIRITGPAREMGKALSDIKEKYNVEEVLPRGIAPIEDLTIIALPKDPNAPSS